MTYGHPGVYVNETLLPAPITAVGGANAAGAAVGVFAQGPTSLTLVRSWYEFVKLFGGYNNKFPATFGVAQFFNNGGTELYVQRILHSDAVKASGNLPASVSGDIATVTAKNLGFDGNNLRVQVTAGATINAVQTYNLTVYKEVITQYLNTNNANSTNDILLETYSNVVFNDVTASNYVETVVNNTSTNITIQVLNTSLTPAVQAATAVIPLIDGNDGSAVVASDFTAVLGTDGSSPFDSVERPLVIFAPEIYSHFYVSTVLSGSVPPTAVTAAEATTTTSATFTYGGTAQVVAVGESVTTTGFDDEPYLNGTFTVSAIGGVSGAWTFTVTDSGFTVAEATTMGTFTVPIQPALVESTAISVALSSMTTVHQDLADWANSGLGFAVLETPPSQGIVNAVSYASGMSATSHAAMYYPNYYIADPMSGSLNSLRKVGPASAVAGLYLTTDKRVGPFKAPAGTTATVRGALNLERSFTSKDLDDLNSASYPLNAIRNIPGAGIVVMGGRTLLQDGTANKYVNMRRSLIYIQKRLQDLTQFAVFQNNDFRLWSQLRNTVTVFLNEYRNQGGLRGATPAQSFYVKVDAENNTPATIQQGIVNIEVGVALEYPAEFVVINLSQTTGI